MKELILKKLTTSNYSHDNSTDCAQKLLNTKKMDANSMI